MASFINRAPIADDGTLLVTTTAPTSSWPVLGGMTYQPSDGALAVVDSVPAATDPAVGGIRFNNAGSMYVTTTKPSPLYYVGGLPVSADGRLFVSSGGSVGLLAFFAPMTFSLEPEVSTNPTPSYSRSTTAYVPAVAPTGNAADGEVLVLVAAGEARFRGARRVAAGNWSPTYADGTPIPADKLLGYTAESVATNLCVQSQTFNHAAWGKVNGTITQNTTAAPDGTLTADTFTTTGNNAICRQSMSISTATYTFSIYLKRLVGTGQVAITTDNVTFADVTSQLSTSAWTRVFTSKALVAGSGATPGFRLAAIGDAVAAWGAQQETGSDPSSYIPTVGVVVTRNVDVLSYPVSRNLDGTLTTAYVEAYLPLASAALPQSLLALSTGNILLITDSTKSAGMNVTGPVLATTNTRTLGAINKFASAWSGSTGSVNMNGGDTAAGTITGLPYAETGNMVIGGSGANSLNGSIRNVRFILRRLSDTELKELTQ